MKEPNLTERSASSPKELETLDGISELLLEIRSDATGDVICILKNNTFTTRTIAIAVIKHHIAAFRRENADAIVQVLEQALEHITALNGCVSSLASAKPVITI